MGLPDAHSGYGFAIGNVAAFDMADPAAIVSPGGVGFDINCLCEGTLVDRADGTSIPIEQVKSGDAVLSVDGSGSQVPRQVTAHLPQGEQECVELMFIDGRTLTCTADHRLMRPDGTWVTADALQVDEAVAAGVQFARIDRGEDGGGWELDVTASLGFRLDMTDRRQQAIAFTRVLGYALSGVGGKIRLDRQLDVESIRADVQLLTTQPATVEKERNDFALLLPQALMAGFASVDVDVGGNPDRLLHLPAFICAPTCPLPLVRAFVSGYFGGGGSSIVFYPLDRGHYMEELVGFSLRSSKANEQLELSKRQLGGLLHRCGIADDQCEWITEADSLTGKGALKASVLFSREATVAFAQSCTFAHSSRKQLRLSAAATLFRAMERARSAQSEMQSAPPQSQAATSRRRPRLAKDGRKAPLTTSDALDCMDAHAVFGDTRNLVKARAKERKKQAALAKEDAKHDDAEEVGSEGQQNGGAAKKAKKSIGAASAVPRSSPLFPLSQSLFHLPLVAKRAVGPRRVFDLSIDPQMPNFTANGVVVHNCGVRLLRTNLLLSDVQPVQEALSQSLFDHIPVGVGSKGVFPTRPADLDAALELGIDWSIREGYAWVEDKEHIEEYGRMLDADVSKVTSRAKKRGLPQLGTLGAGNHYVSRCIHTLCPYPAVTLPHLSSSHSSPSSLCC